MEDEEENYQNALHFILHFIICFLIGNCNLFFFLLVLRNKTPKVKKDIFLMEKNIIIILMLLLVIIKPIFIIWNINQENITWVTTVIYNFLLIPLVLLKFFGSIEDYLTFKRPNHFFNSFIYRYYTNIFYEIIALIIAIVYMGAGCMFGDVKIEKYEVILEIFCPLITISNYLLVIPLIFIILSIFIYMLPIFTISNILFHSKAALNKIIRNNIILSLIYFVYFSYQLILLYFIKIKHFSIENIKIWYIINSYLSILFLLCEFIFDLLLLSDSQFCEFKVRKTLIGRIAYKLSYKSKKEKSVVNILSNSNITNSYTPISIDLSNPILMQNQQSADIINCFKNGIIIEDYIFNYYEVILNLSIISILNIYKSSTYNEKNLDLPETFNEHETLNKIPGILLSEKKMLYQLNERVDDFKEYLKLLTSIGAIKDKQSVDIKIEITSMYTEKIKKIITQRSLDIEKIRSSLSSHFNKSKDVTTLLGSNVPEEFFKNARSLVIKTKDKELLMEVYHCSNSESPNTFKKLDTTFESYYNYIQEASETFLPIIVGVFKVRINSLQSLLIFISRNSLIENAPKEFYKYWQCIRFKDTSSHKVASSKVKRHIIVTDDFLFEPEVDIHSGEEGVNYHKILLNNIFDFKDTIHKDVELLTKIKSKKFSLMLMYYELENISNVAVFSPINEEEKKTKEQKQQKAIEPINNNGDISLEIIPEERKEEEKIVNKDDDLSKALENETALTIKNLSKGNFFDFSEQISITGYEGKFQEYCCICFFIFENMFEEGGDFKMINLYSKFKEKLFSYFGEISKAI